ncbi:short-chain dehydrogenase/reductase SDR [Lepidopterella palustris CBS 459.81]|uniref:Short-chain dehydrogenase/reductase SDR n=1 Tax=Lepidopterella palustris CBS 459.81 TaxID=1314670 RepID=A0A8E2JJU3_9PEZI|nr:short-chain dehydrogenase/reductase SDR [Lepidopterella palustris CBS 459.81]
MSRFSLKGRTALVTGGARGCGLAFAEGLAEAGADVAIFDVIPPTEGFFEIGKTYGVKSRHYIVDVSSISSLEAGFESFKTDFNGALDICVPCAGVNANVSFLDTTPEQFENLTSVNIRGVYYTAQLAAKAMIANHTTHGSIILVASIASYMAIRSQLSSAYCGTKGAVRAMCPAIAAELVKYGIRVNSISPGYVRTEMTAPFPHLLESWKDEIMNGRVAMPEDIRGGCVFLASDASLYMTGQDLCIDGGVTKW